MILEKDIYINTVDKVIKLSNDKLCSDISMMEKQLAIENIKKANLSNDEILSFLEKKNQTIIEYSVKKISLVSAVNEIDENDDYYPDDDYYDDEEDEDMGLSQTFLIDYIIEIILIEKGDSYLEIYLKKLKIPNSKKYALELRAIYNLI